MLSQPVSTNENPGIDQQLLIICGLSSAVAAVVAAQIVSTFGANVRLTTEDAFPLARALDSGRSVVQAVNALVLNT